MLQTLSVTLLIPLFNEKDSVRELVRRLREVMEKQGLTYEIVFVDDGSRDGSAALLDDLFQENQHVNVIHFRRNFGKSAALAAGFDAARGEIVITMDADLQDDPSEIPKFLDKIHEGFDLVSGWKYPRKDPVTRRMASWVYNRMARFITGVRLHDMNCGFKAYRLEAVKDLNIYGDLHRYIPVLADSYGYRIAEIKVAHHQRAFGKSKYGVKRFFSGFFDIITVLMLTRFSSRPFHFFGLMGMVLTLIGSGFTAYLSVRKLMGYYLSDRPLLFLALSLLIVGLQIIFFGLLAEMIAQSRDSKDHYSVRDRKFHQ